MIDKGKGNVLGVEVALITGHRISELHLERPRAATQTARGSQPTLHAGPGLAPDDGGGAAAGPGRASPATMPASGAAATNTHCHGAWPTM